MAAEIDTFNTYMVGATVAGDITILSAQINPSRLANIAPEAAIVLAAWIVALAEPSSSVTFADAFEAVRHS